MSLEAALRATEILLALAFLQQCAEHVMARHWQERALFGLRGLASLVLLTGLAPLPALGCLAGLSLVILHYFQGVYNGGSDRMGLLVLWCLLAAHLAPTPFLSELFLAYLALQLVMSYFVSGKVKLQNPDWRSGRALSDVFAFSAYPVSQEVRALSSREDILWLGSWSVILFEVMFPIALFNQTLLVLALVMGFGFHVANALLFGLNRFVWAWLAAYPSLFWLQDRILNGF